MNSFDHASRCDIGNKLPVYISTLFNDCLLNFMIGIKFLDSFQFLRTSFYLVLSVFHYVPISSLLYRSSVEYLCKHRKENETSHPPSCTSPQLMYLLFRVLY